MHALRTLVMALAALGAPACEEAVDRVAPAPAPSVRFEPVWDGAPLAPVRLAAADDGTLWLSETTRDRVVKLRGTAPELMITGLGRPLALAVSANRLYVGSATRRSVDVFDVEARRFLFSLGTGPGEVEMPNDLVVAPDGTIFVVDSTADCVRIFASDGARRGRLGEGELRFPAAVAVTGDRVFVADQGHHRVAVYDHDGRLVQSFGEALPMGDPALPGRFTRLQALTLSTDRTRLHTLDSYHAVVQTFTLDGRHVGLRGRRGSCEGCLGLSLGLAVETGDALLAGDPDHGRVVRLPESAEEAR